MKIRSSEFSKYKTEWKVKYEKSFISEISAVFLFELSQCHTLSSENTRGKKYKKFHFT